MSKIAHERRNYKNKHSHQIAFNYSRHYTPGNSSYFDTSIFMLPDIWQYNVFFFNNSCTFKGNNTETYVFPLRVISAYVKSAHWLSISNRLQTESVTTCLIKQLVTVRSRKKNCHVPLKNNETGDGQCKNTIFKNRHIGEIVFKKKSESPMLSKYARDVRSWPRTKGADWRALPSHQETWRRSWLSAR